MSLGNKTFMQSFIMREFAQNAKKRGWVKDKPIQKKASKKRDYEPTGDLLLDLSKLSDGLRDKGFISEAKSLEKKIRLYKQAEIHLYKVHEEDGDDLLDFAYPDGDVEISPAQDELGKVFGPLGQKKKIMDVVKKKPTGKLASAALRLKQAQFGFEEEVVDEDDPVAMARQRAEQGMARVDRARRNYSNIDTSQLTFAGGRWQSAPSLYASVAGVSVNEIMRYMNVKSVLGAPTGKAVTPAFVKQIMTNGNGAYSTISSAAKMLGVDVSNNYMGVSSRGTVWVTETNDYPDNPNSVFYENSEVGKNSRYFDPNSKGANDVATKISTAFQALYANLWGANGEKIQKATEKLQGLKPAVQNLLNGPDFSSKGLTDAGDVNLNQVRARLLAGQKAFAKAYNSGSRKQLVSALQALGPESAVEAEAQFWGNLAKIMREVLVSMAGGSERESKLVQDYSGQVTEAIRFYSDEMKASEEGSENRRNAAFNVQKLVRLRSIFANNADQPFAVLAAALQDSGFPSLRNAKSAKDVEAFLNALNEGIRQ